MAACLSGCGSPFELLRCQAFFNVAQVRFGDAQKICLVFLWQEIYIIQDLPKSFLKLVEILAFESGSSFSVQPIDFRAKSFLKSFPGPTICRNFPGFKQRDCHLSCARKFGQFLLTQSSQLSYFSKFHK
jgi:hypothetical protein